MRYWLLLGLLCLSCAGTRSSQTPDWSAQDERDYLNGSMSSEFVPERVLNAFIATYPELYPGGLKAFLVSDPTNEGLPVGFSRRKVAHLGNQVSIGINCSACHVGEFREAPDRPPIRVFGAVSSFDSYTFFGALAVAMVWTTQPANMERFLGKYLGRSVKLDKAQLDAIAADPMGSKGTKPDALHDIAAADLEAGNVTAVLRLFHNIRTALHIPEQLPPPLTSLPGPGRTDAFGVLAAALFGLPVKMDAPVKYGIPWDLAGRKWVHWDGNSNNPYARNLGASLGLGAPMFENGRLADFSLIGRQTDLSHEVRAPKWPWAIDRDAAARGEAHYRARCASCHDRPEDDRMYSLQEVGTDPNRARFFDDKQRDLNNNWVRSLKVAGYVPTEQSYRSTGKYWAAGMAGVWARAPYLHNGSVRTMWELLTDPAKRPKTWKRGTTVYDRDAMGFVDDGRFVFDVSISGNSNAGHAYGTDLTDAQKRDLIEYLKTR